MGTNSKSSHENYVIAPSNPATEPSTAPAAAEDTDEVIAAKAAVMVAMDTVHGFVEGGEGALGGYPELPEDPVEAYEAFAEHVQAAQKAIDDLQAQGASDEEIKALRQALRAQSLQYLNALSPEVLQQIAASQGFEHPALVGLSGAAQHPLVHWLDPYYGNDIVSKQKIQAAAHKRYEQLAAGQTVGGMTMADLQQIEGTTGAPDAPEGTWAATADQVKAAKEAWNKAGHDVAYSKGALDSEKLHNLLEAEKQILTAHNPDLPELETLKNQIKVWTEDPLAHAKITTSTVMPLVKDALANGDMSQTEALHLKPRELVGLLRAGTPEAEKVALAATALARVDQLEALDKALGVHQEGKANAHSGLNLPDLAGNPAAAAHVAAWAQSTGELQSLQQDAQGWIHETLQPSSDIGFANPALLTSHTVDTKALTTEFNAWAKGQKLADLRTVAGELGMPDTDKANRSHLQNYIASSWNPALDKDAINAKVAAAAAKKASPPPAAPAGGSGSLASEGAVQALASKLTPAGGGAPASTPSKIEAALAGPAAPPVPAPGTGTGGPSKIQAALDGPPPAGAGLTQQSKVDAAIAMGATPAQAQKLAQGIAKPPAPAAKPSTPKKPAAPGSFNAKVQALVANLQQVKANAQDVPVRIDSGVVDAWSFGAGTPANLGGTYPKTLHTAPDGSSWLFKADHNGQGAIAHAEAAASHALSLGGVAAVPVYAKTVEGKHGTVQPMLKGATHFTTEPKAWSQAEVDGIVRSHVGSWLVGDHDGHQDNMLRTASGGLVQIDRGQSFKHFGSDKLAVGYAPSGGGGHTPVHQKLYTASLGGGLADGVKINPSVAHPVINAFESVPDSQWRSMLHSTAHEGAKAGVHWVPAMRKAAAKQHGVKPSLVTHAQIADAFLDHAVERKNTLRTSFTDFFVKQLKLPSAASLKHGGS